MIETMIKIDLRGVCSPSKVFLGNQYENIDHILKFEFDEELDVMNKYIILNHQERTVIYPLINNQIKITNSVTSYAGFWNIHVMCRDFEVDLDTEPIELDAKENEHVYISNSFLGIVNKANFKKEDVENYEMDENLQIIYDDLLALKLELENGGVGVKDVKINDTSIVTDGVANIPIASDSNLGLVKASSSYGFVTTPSGYLNTANVANSDIDDRKQTRILKPCHIDYAVKQALCDGKGAEWDTTEQANAKKRIGIDRDLEFLSNAIEGKTTQPYIDSNFKTNLNDSDKGLLKNIDVRGKTEQVQYTGKNLIDVFTDVTGINTTDKSVITVSDKGIVSQTVANSNNNYGVVLLKRPLELGTYTINMNANFTGAYGNSPHGMRVQITDTSGVASDLVNTIDKLPQTFTVDKEHQYITIYYYVGYPFDGTDGVLTLSDIQLEKGSSATSYEPYVGGIPSPNIDYPQEMVSSNKLDLKVCGRNIVNLPQVLNVTSLLRIDFKINETFTVSWGDVTYEGDNAPVMAFYDVRGVALTYITFNNNKKITLPVKDTAVNEAIIYTNGFNYNASVGISCTINNLQMEIGSTASEYEEYQEQVINYELPITMKSNATGTSYDFIDLDKGKIIQNIYEIEFDGNEDEKWTVYRTGTKVYGSMIVPSEEMDFSYGGEYCDMFTNSNSGISSKDYECFQSSGRALYFLFNKERLNSLTVDGVKEFLKTNPIKVQYTLLTPIEHDLPQELINQLKALYTYYGATNIVSSLPIKFDYKLNMPSWYGIISKTVSDTRSIIYDMETQTLQNAIDTAYVQMLLEEGAM